MNFDFQKKEKEVSKIEYFPKSKKFPKSEFFLFISLCKKKFPKSNKFPKSKFPFTELRLYIQKMNSKKIYIYIKFCIYTKIELRINFIYI